MTDFFYTAFSNHLFTTSLSYQIATPNFFFLVMFFRASYDDMNEKHQPDAVNNITSLSQYQCIIISHKKTRWP